MLQTPNGPTVLALAWRECERTPGVVAVLVPVDFGGLVVVCATMYSRDSSVIAGDLVSTEDL